jgi:hypothetical protein
MEESEFGVRRAGQKERTPLPDPLPARPSRGEGKWLFCVAFPRATLGARLPWADMSRPFGAVDEDLDVSSTAAICSPQHLQIRIMCDHLVLSGAFAR